MKRESVIFHLFISSLTSELRFSLYPFVTLFLRLYADLLSAHVVVLRLVHSLKIFVKPSHDVLQALRAALAPRGAGKLVRFAGKADHDHRPLQELERAEHFLAARARRRAI